MNRFLAIAGLLLLGLMLGLLVPDSWLGDGGAMDEAMKDGGEEEILYWVAPMDANYRRDEPGKSPMGMDLVPVYANEAGGGDGVTIAPEVVQNMGVRTAVVERGPLWRRIEATGHVGLDERLTSHIHLRTQGWIEDLRVDAEGDPVSEGQVLFTLYSPELVSAQKEYLQAQRRGERLLLEAAGDNLRSLGMTGGQIEDLAQRGKPLERLPILSPQDGILVELNVRENMFVRPADIVMSLADLSRVWVHARVFESRSEWVEAGQSAEVRLDYLPGRTFEGEVDYVYPVLDPESRTLRVRLVFDNPERLLRPNMYAEVVIYGGAKRDVLSIPRDALIRGERMDRVVVSKGEGRFEVHEVVAGIESGDWVEIRRGLKVGDRVVTSAQFMIDSEASISGSIRRLSSMDDAEDGGPVFGAGTVNSVDPEAGTVNLSHEPIGELGWPAMTMNLAVTEAVDLASVPAGAEIHFSLRKETDGSYLIDMIHVMENGAGHD